MPKIPKNLSDKDMFQDYVEEETLEDKFIAAEKAADKKRREQAKVEPPAELARAGFTPELTDKLGRALLELRMALATEGIRDYSFKIRREGRSILLTAVDKGKKQSFT